MPLYDFECLDCGERFEALVLGRGAPSCPICHGSKLEKLVSTFAVNSAATRKTNLTSGRRERAKARHDRAVAEHEQIHKNLEH